MAPTPASRQRGSGNHRGVEVRPEAVRQARLEAGLSLAQLAGDEVTRAAIHMVETGKMRPSLRTLHLIARRTGRPLSFFLPGEEGSSEQRSSRDRLKQMAKDEDFQSAVELGEWLLEREIQPGIAAEVRFLVGHSYVRMHVGRTALGYLRRAREYFETVGDRRMAVVSMDQEATALMLLDDPRAFSTALEALQRCERLRPPCPSLQGRILVHLGSMSVRRGDWRNAARFLEKGLELSQSAPNPHEMGMVHDGLSLTYQHLGDFSAALDEAEHALTLSAADRDPTSLPRIEHHLGSILLRQGETGAAALHLDRALGLYQRQGLVHGARDHVLCTLGDLHIVRGELDEAEGCLREALRIAQAYGERACQGVAWRLLGRLELRRGATGAADLAFAAALEQLRQVAAPDDLRDCLIEYAEALQAQARLEESIARWRQAAEIDRSPAPTRPGASLVDEAGA